MQWRECLSLRGRSIPELVTALLSRPPSSWGDLCNRGEGRKQAMPVWLSTSSTLFFPTLLGWVQSQFLPVGNLGRPAAAGLSSSRGDFCGGEIKTVDQVHSPFRSYAKLFFTNIFQHFGLLHYV